MVAKTCTQPIELPDYDGKMLTIESGTSIQLPVYAIHHDERFYIEANTFRPDRFLLQSAKEHKKLGQFFPFGDGPRQCLGKPTERYTCTH